VASGITLRAVGGLPPDLPDLLKQLARGLSTTLGVAAIIGEGLPLPPAAHNPRRDQHSAAELLYALRDATAQGETALGVTEADLYVPGEDFVFGQAAPGIGTAIVSTHRLHAEPPDEELLRSRLVKEAAHEIGHLWLLRHCRRRSCLMAPVINMESVDRKTLELCNTCRDRLRRRVPAS
jgi:archaemetzincin